jgi:hypothetical protein
LKILHFQSTLRCVWFIIEPLIITVWKGAPLLFFFIEFGLKGENNFSLFSINSNLHISHFSLPTQFVNFLSCSLRLFSLTTSRCVLAKGWIKLDPKFQKILLKINSNVFIFYITSITFYYYSNKKIITK